MKKKNNNNNDDDNSNNNSKSGRKVAYFLHSAVRQSVFSVQNRCAVPVFGWLQVSSEKIREVLPQVLDAGYRHIDTAYSYGNEAAIGDVLNDYFAQGKLKRDDVFVATKVGKNKQTTTATKHYGYEKTH